MGEWLPNLLAGIKNKSNLHKKYRLLIFALIFSSAFFANVPVTNSSF